MRVQSFGNTVFSNFSNTISNPIYKKTPAININQEISPKDKISFNKTEAVLNEDENKFVEKLKIEDEALKTHKADVYEKYKNNQNFKNILNNNLFKSDLNKHDLVDIVYSIDVQKDEATKKINNPFYHPISYPDINAYYAGLDVDKCLKNLDNFFNSKFSDDLKIFMAKSAEKLKDGKFISENLSNIDKNNPNITVLTNDFALC